MRLLTIFTLLFSKQFIFAQFVIFGNPNLITQTQSSLEIQYTTNTNARTLVQYGKTPALEMGYLNNGQTTMAHNILLNGLEAGSIYYVKACAIIGPDTSRSTKTAIFATVSNSTGSIRIFFNRSIDNTVSNGTYPHITNSPAAIQAELIKRIDSAKANIDIAVYNNNTNAIVTALNNAHNRGVRVRYVHNISTANTALSNAQFPTLGVNTVGLMHNKFLVADPDSVNQSYVWTGSMNWTSNNINDDYNNVVLIQDQSLARTYKIEFEEMWGSTTANPNAGLSKSGSQKTDNTPHQFIIGGNRIESYFSPSDGTTAKIEQALLSAGGDLEVALLTLTHNDLSNALINRHNSGERVAALIENIGDQGSDFTTLQNAGVDARQYTPTFDLHHKYGIIDANTPNSDPTVVTGSHNWSYSAEQVNDENTLIIHNANIANWFLQEFSKRYCEVSTQNPCSYNPAVSTVDLEFSEIQIFPNPFQNQFQIQGLKEGQRISLFNSLGQSIYSEIAQNSTSLIDFSSFSNGFYNLVIEDKLGNKKAYKVFKID